MSRKLVGAALGCLAGANVAAAQPVTFYCNFSTVSALATTAFAPEGFRIGPAREFNLTFVIDGTRSYMVGNLGTANLEMHPIAGGGVVFIEAVPSGVRQVTAIDARGNAAHSRNTSVPLRDGSGMMLFPQQYYGRCQRRD